MANIEKIASELLSQLSSMCELDRETQEAIRPSFLEVLKKHITDAPSASEKPEKTKKASKKSTEPKPEKLTKNNAYHFFVAAKMGVVKDSGVAAKERMTTIGEMWKKLSDDERKVFQDQALHYNEVIEAEQIGRASCRERV